MSANPVGPAPTLTSWDALGPAVPRSGNRLTRGLARLLLRLGGWRVEGTLPDLAKFVITAAPHTSNWDFVVGALAKAAVGIRLSFFGKDTLFRPPLGWYMRWLGGQPVDRSESHGIVQRTVETIRRAPHFVLAIAPEGTRKRAPEWRTGFYHMAYGAGLPILLGSFDYGRRVIGFGPLIQPSGDVEADLGRIQAFYRGVRGKRPDRFATAADGP